uniref:Uncharacterized protein n=1 Tax=Molossus molossus TaxID=27622 RepID=A0A7J8DT80_MOLMO|nr:hypothetical protein HJG59_009138 [Molossus molossus]
MNRTLKETLTKFTLETGENWTTLLPSPSYSSYRPCSLPRRPSINTSAMPCLCPPQTLCTLSSQGLDPNKEIHHPRTNSGLEGTIHCHPAFTNGYQGQRHPGLAASFLVEGRKSRMNGADLSRSLKMRLLRLSGL